MKKLKIALLSFAHVHARSYVQLLKDRDDVEFLSTDVLFGPAPEDELRGRAQAEEWGAPYVETLDEIWEWGPDAVVVQSENVNHRPLVEAAAAHGAHILCEKPLATTVADGEAMLQACADNNVFLMMAYPIHFESGVETVRELVSSGKLGTVVGATGTNTGRIPVNRRAWFCDPEQAGGGALVDHTVHCAELLDYLLGSEPVKVHAVANKIFHADHPKVHTETAGLVTVTYANGIVATIDCSWSLLPEGPLLDGLTLEVVGSDGIASVDTFGTAVEGYASQPGMQRLPFGPNLDGRMVEAFLEGVRTGQAPQPDGAAGLRTQRIVNGALDSFARGEAVQV